MQHLFRRFAACGIAFSAAIPVYCDGKNPFDCQNPACSSKMDMLQQAMGNGKKFVIKPAMKPVDKMKECPLDREELGNATWKLLHTIAANYPEHPSEADVNNITTFISTLSKLYPCPYCAEDFRAAIEEAPIEYKYK